MSIELRDQVANLHWGNIQNPVAYNGKEYNCSFIAGNEWQVTSVMPKHYMGLKFLNKLSNNAVDLSAKYQIIQALKAEGITPIQITDDAKTTFDKDFSEDETSDSWEVVPENFSPIVTSSNVTAFLQTTEGQVAASIVAKMTSTPACNLQQIEYNRSGMSASEPDRLYRCPFSGEVITLGNAIQVELSILEDSKSESNAHELNTISDSNDAGNTPLKKWVTVSKYGFRSHLAPGTKKEYTKSKLAIDISNMTEKSVRAVESDGLTDTLYRAKFK
ncbi:MAG: hypothetical protein HAW66_08395 [Shewanella sp.]|nr:hypothetical protein [Shewanella sp.]